MSTSLKNTTGAIKVADSVYNFFAKIVHSAGSVGHALHNAEISAAKYVGNVASTTASNAVSGFTSVPGSLYGNSANGTSVRTIAPGILHPIKKPTAGGGGSNKGGGGAPPPPVAPTNNTPTNIKFNLAPHNWSLPTNQKLFNTSSDNQTQADQSVRRARMWCYLGASDSNYATETQTGSTQAGVVTGGTNVSKSLDTQWGFQFLWNPTQISTSVQRNANLVPQAMDAFAGRAPLFPGTEALSFVAVINRVNDFACFKAAPDQAPYHAEMYPKSAGAGNNTSALIKDLMLKGTMADIEFIFKMINGDGANGATWTNALGRKTADINFLAPTPVAVQFGPNADSLSYVGWVESISVSHQMFTEDMIPVHSEVTINMSTYSQSSLK